VASGNGNGNGLKGRLLEAGEKSLDDLDVTLDAEDQGDVDVRALRDHRLDRGQPRGSARLADA